MTDDLALTPDQTAEHERLLLACALQNADTARELLRTVQAPMIADGGLARAWSALRRVLAAEIGPVDMASAVAAELAGKGDDAPGLVDLHDLTLAVPSAANATWYARQVVDAYVRREAAGMLSEADFERNRDRPTADLLAGIEERSRHLRELRGGAGAAPRLVSAAEYATVPQPAPVLWRDPDATEIGTDVDAVLSVGECAILASAGGLGKSTFTLEIASAAVGVGDDYGTACGLRMAAGPVVLVSYEDAPARIAHRLRWMNAGDVPAAVHLVPDPTPLWTADVDHNGSSHPGAEWDALWREIRAGGARIVVIDPVSAALADVSTTETGPVRAFLRALTAEAAPDPDEGWPGCGVLLVAHDTKAARNALARGEDPGAGVVAGSAAWYDGARGVLALMLDPQSDDRLLECVKANYGRTGWGARLIERTGPGGAFRGLELGVRMRRADLAAAKHPPKKRDKAAANGAGTVPAQDVASA